MCVITGRLKLFPLLYLHKLVKQILSRLQGQLKLPKNNQAIRYILSSYMKNSEQRKVMKKILIRKIQQVKLVVQPALMYIGEYFQSNIVENYFELKNFLELKKGQFNLRLIFRASEHNFDVAKFHKLCKNYTHTVVLAEINNGNIVGGYSPLSWQDNYEKAGTHYKTDKTQQAFIFNFTSKEKYKLVKCSHNKAIVGCKHLGPTFGGGYDLSIGNFANKKYSSSCNFPTSYSKEIAELRNFKLTRKSLLGISDHEQLFFIKQWQVFEVCFDNTKQDEKQGNQNQQPDLYQTIRLHDNKKKEKNNLWQRIQGIFSSINEKNQKGKENS